MPLHHSVVRAPGAQPERAVLFLHGILGQGNNWRTFARELVALRPEFEAVLIDLRAHGDSRSQATGADSLANAAHDVAQLASAHAVPVHAVLGHSFGGKVALALLERTDIELETLISVDSLPGARPDQRGSEGTVAVVDGLAALPPSFDSREEFLAELRSQGRSDVLAKWLAMNVDRTEDGRYRFGLDVTRIRALLDDYFARDLWPLMDPPPHATRVHLVIGGRSTVYSESDHELARALAARHADRVFAHVLPKADHWVHVDDPQGLLAIVRGAL